MGQWQNSEGVNERLMIDTCSGLSLSPTVFCVIFAMIGTRGLAQFCYCCSLEITHLTMFSAVGSLSCPLVSESHHKQDLSIRYVR